MTKWFVSLVKENSVLWYGSQAESFLRFPKPRWGTERCLESEGQTEQKQKRLKPNLNCINLLSMDLLHSMLSAADPSIFWRLFLVQHGGNKSRRETQRSLFPVTLSSSTWAISRLQGLLLVGGVQKTSRERCPGDTLLTRNLNQLTWLLWMWRSSVSTWISLLMKELLTQVYLRLSSTEEAHCSCLYPRSCFLWSWFIHHG